VTNMAMTNPDGTVSTDEQPAEPGEVLANRDDTVVRTEDAAWADDAQTNASSLTVLTIGRRSPGSARVWPKEVDRRRELQESDLYSHWEWLCRDRRYPAASLLNAKKVSFYWPNSVLFRCLPGGWFRPWRVEVDMFYGRNSTIRAVEVQRGTGWDDIAMIAAMALPLARKVARRGQPAEIVELLPGTSSTIRYRGLALPFSEDGRRVDHVLCHVGQQHN